MNRFTLPCRAGELRGLIRHSHLQNRFISALPDNPDNLRTIYGGTSKILEEFRELNAELLTCLEDSSGGFCAIGLVDTLPPLRELSEIGREQLKKAIAAAYEDQFHPRQRAAAIRETGERLLALLADFLADEDCSAAAVDNLRNAAVDLFHLISDLPRGIWLWPQKEAK